MRYVMPLWALIVVPTNAMLSMTAQGSDPSPKTVVPKKTPSSGRAMTYSEARRTLILDLPAVTLLSSPSVQFDLVFEEKAGQIYRVLAVISRKKLEASRKLRELGRDAEPEKIGKIVDDYEVNSKKALKSVLSNEQLKRLDQMSLQYIGAAAFTTEMVVKELKITDKQLASLRKLHRDARDASFRLTLGNRRKTGFANARKSLQERDALRRKFVLKAIEVLTKEQQAKYEKMVGKPYQFAPP